MTVRLVSSRSILPAAQPRPPDLGALLRLVEKLAPCPGDVVPADPHVLASLWEGPAPSPAALTALVTRAVATGVLRTVVLGREPHLALPAPTPTPRLRAWPTLEPLPAGPSTEQPASEPNRDARPVDPNAPTPVRAPVANGAFDAQVAVDMERERILLYRVALVVEGIIALVAVRGLVLGFLGV